jgi:mono/diheme cytochrome c family protein
MKTWTLALLLSAISSSVLISNAMAEETQHTMAPYRVVDGNKLDTNSYKGFKLFRNWCARCHGTYGQGMVGPNLADSLKIISKEEFYATVENGKTGTIGSMPAWKSNEKVMEGRDSLYAYLKARSDGAIGEVKPSKQK